MLAALDQGYADPRRLHTPARNARLILDNAREAVAEALGVRRDEVSFTSSGTDAVHRGPARAGPPGGAVAHAAVEHSAVLTRWPGGPTCGVRPVRVDHLGRVDPDRPRRPRRHRRSSTPTTRSAPSSRSPRPRRSRRSSWTPAPRWAGSRSPRAGRWPPAPRTSGAGRPASGCCWSARGRRGATRSRRTTGSTSGWRASRTSPPHWAPPPRSRPWSPSATRSTPASTPSSTGSGPGWRDPRHRGGRRPGRPAPPPGHVLVPLRRRRGDRRRAQPARLRGRERLGLHRLHPRAQPRAGGDGRAHPRQRPGLADPRRRPRPTWTASWPCSPRSSQRSARTPDCEPTPTSSSTAAGCVCPLPVIELGKRIGEVEVGQTVAVASTDAAAAYDIPAWCRMRGQEYVGEEPADDGVPRYLVRRAS